MVLFRADGDLLVFATSGVGKHLLMCTRTCPVVQPWLYGYDAYREVEAVTKGSSKL